MTILDFPMNDRMYSIWMARMSGIIVNKYDVKPNSEEYFMIMDALSSQIEDDAKEWTAEMIDKMVDSCFEEVEIVIVYKRDGGSNDNEQ